MKAIAEIDAEYPHVQFDEGLMGNATRIFYHILTTLRDLN
jgi:hypothetical protein